MRIVSKFYDFYDGLQRLDEDRDDVWVRNTEEILVDRKSVFPFTPNLDLWIPYGAKDVTDKGPRYKYRRFRPNEVVTKLEKNIVEWNIEMFVVGFCGKTYPGLKFEGRRIGFDGFPRESIKSHIYDPEEMLDFTEKYGMRFFDDRETFHRRKRQRFFSARRSEFSDELTYENIRRRFDSLASRDVSKVFRDHDTPIFTYERSPAQGVSIFRSSPMLSPYEFAKFLDPYTAYQEIDMYRSGVLGAGRKELIQISDEDMRDKKGFNDQSFKNPSPNQSSRMARKQRRK